MKEAATALQSILGELQGIASTAVEEPDRPVQQVVQEAIDIAGAASVHRPALLATGISGELIDQLPVRTAALREAHARWVMTRDRALSEAQKALIVQGEDLRSEILHAVYFALRELDAESEVGHVHLREGVADLARHLGELAQAMSTHREPFERIRYDHASVTHRARAMAKELAAIHTSDAPTSAEGLRDVRDRSYTYLMQAVVEVCVAAQYAFHGDATSERSGRFRVPQAVHTALRWTPHRAPAQRGIPRARAGSVPGVGGGAASALV